ncbi:MAG: phosphatase PAP2 family protein [Actinobacteria bacterium]|nr:phosphatase PAP2 family protein [Actinomycetota bacterium]
MGDVIDAVHALDDAVDKWLELHRSERLDRLFYGLSSAADHGLLWHALGAVRALRRREPGYALRFSTALGIESALTNGLVKLLFRRMRPPDHFENDDPLPYGMRRPITSSFPSGHAATAFMCAVLLSKGNRAGPAYFSLAALVAASRVYTRMHHASDVAAGAVLGLVLGSAARSKV